MNNKIRNAPKLKIKVITQNNVHFDFILTNKWCHFRWFFALIIAEILDLAAERRGLHFCSRMVLRRVLAAGSVQRIVTSHYRLTLHKFIFNFISQEILTHCSVISPKSACSCFLLVGWFTKNNENEWLGKIKLHITLGEAEFDTLFCTRGPENDHFPLVL